MVPGLAAVKESADIALSLAQQPNGAPLIQLVLGTITAFASEFGLTVTASIKNAYQAKRAIFLRIFETVGLVNGK